MDNRRFDEIDSRILNMLASDGRIPFQEVARACGVSGTTIHTRVARLTSLGVIRGAEFVIDPSKIGYESCAYVGLKLKEGTDFDDTVAALAEIPEVVEIHCTNEDYDLLVKVYAHNNAHLMEIIRQKISPLGLTKSRIIMSFQLLHSKQLTAISEKMIDE